MTKQEFLQGMTFKHDLIIDEGKPITCKFIKKTRQLVDENGEYPVPVLYTGIREFMFCARDQEGYPTTCYRFKYADCTLNIEKEAIK